MTDSVMHNYEVCAYPGCCKVRTTFSFALNTPKFCASHRSPGMMKNTAKTRAIVENALVFFYHHFSQGKHESFQGKSADVKVKIEPQEMDWQPTVELKKRKQQFYDLDCILDGK